MKPDKNPSKKFIKRFQKIYTNNIYTYTHAHMFALTHIHTLTYNHTQINNARKKKKRSKKGWYRTYETTPILLCFPPMKTKSVTTWREKSIRFSFFSLPLSEYPRPISLLDFWVVLKSPAVCLPIFLQLHYTWLLLPLLLLQMQHNSRGRCCGSSSQHTASLISWFKSWIRS